MSAHTPSGSNIRALIFRKRLLATSEGFIVDQARHLPSAQAAFLGLERDCRSPVDFCGPVFASRTGGFRGAIARLRTSLGLGPDRATLEWIRSFSPTLVHAHFATSGITPLLLAEKFALPLLVTAHGYDVTRHTLRPKEAKRRDALLSSATRVIAVSEFIASKLAARGLPRERIVQHYIGIDPRPFDNPKSESDTPTVLFVGRLTEVKGCQTLLEAMVHVRAQVPDARLRFIGDGPLRKDLMEQATDTDFVDFLGVQNRATIAEELKSAWVHCNPSVALGNGAEEAFGLVFLEAQASGTPTVSFDTGGVPEAIEHGKTGYSLKDRTPLALAEALVALLKSPQLRRQMGEAGRARVRTRFDVRDQSRALEQIYCEAMKSQIA